MFSDEYNKTIPALKSREDLENEIAYLKQRLIDVEAQLYSTLQQFNYLQSMQHLIPDPFTQQGQL